MKNRPAIRSFLIVTSIIMTILPVALFSNTFIVTNTMDSGLGTLRDALQNANNNVGPDTIIFNIPEANLNFDPTLGVWTIEPDSALPQLTDNGTFIDGKSQAVFIGTDTNPQRPEIEISGENAGSADGFYILSAKNIIDGLVVNRFERFGIHIMFSDARENVVRGNYIGTDVTGTEDQGNGFSGIIIYNGAKKNVIGGNRLDDRNIISGNGWSGVEIQSYDADSNIVIGNYIGTDVTGTQALGNDMIGINIWSFAKSNIIGGTTPGERNVISGNQWSGISLVLSDSNRVFGNYIGTSSDARAALPNGHSGIGISGSYNIIGGLATGEANLISGNDENGVVVAVGAYNSISGNFIGTDVNGNLPLPNEVNGIRLHTGAKNNTVGPQNSIKFNILDGVRVEHDSTLFNTITQNMISGNGGLGINNVDGGNGELPRPEIVNVTLDAIAGTAPPNSIVEIFSDPSGQGLIFDGSFSADALGDFAEFISLTGPNVTATATDANGNTSEFSEPEVLLNSYDVSGNVLYYFNAHPIQGAYLFLASDTAVTDVDGNYAFVEAPQGSYSLRAEHSGNIGDAISAFDASMILRHVVSLIALTPKQMIAADVSNNGSVSAFDASHVLRYVVGMISEFPIGADWKFVPANSLIDNTNWNAAPAEIVFDPLDTDYTDQNFHGIIYGDVSGNWSNTNLAKQSAGQARVEFGAVEFVTKNHFKIPVNISVNSELFSVETKINFDDDQFRLKRLIQAGEASNFQLLYHQKSGEINVAMASAEPLTGEAVLFELEFESSVKNLQVPIDLEILSFEGNEGQIKVQVDRTQLDVRSMLPKTHVLEQNAPNPFNASTTIRYQLAEPAQVEIVIFDVTGKQVMQFNPGQKSAGYHSCLWDGMNQAVTLVSSGLYLYEIKAQFENENVPPFVGVKKMIIMK